MQDNALNQSQLSWRNGQPYSTHYEDVYFSTNQDNPDLGRLETEYVFLKHNDLSARWKTITLSNFVIAETGFGTGLNFLSACKLWLDCAPPDSILDYISCEKHPINQQDLRLIYAKWPIFSSLTHALLAVYQTPCAGFHTFCLFNGRIRLSLLIGDATLMLSQLKAKVDAWFLDGFSPAKNPDMWQTNLYSQMARLSYQETTFATFTSAGHVKRGLEGVGFRVKKSKGFGQKREMLFGKFSSQTLKSQFQKKSAIIIGAGISGCSTAYALAKRGWKVQLIERHATIANEASGNPVGVLYPRLASHDSALDQLSLIGYLYTIQLFKELNLPQNDFNLCGLLQLGFNVKEQLRISQIAARNFESNLLEWLTPDQASIIANIDISYPALYFPQAGWVNPRAFCEHLTQHPNITVVNNTQAMSIEQHQTIWQVKAKNTCLEADQIVICNANDAFTFKQTSHLPLNAVRGQMSSIKANANSTQLKLVLCSDGYVTPAIQHQHYAGATFTPADKNLAVSQADNLKNLNMVKQLSPTFGKLEHLTNARVGLRCTTPDYLPLLGGLCDAKKLQNNPPKHINPPPKLPILSGLYIHVAHGAKGLTTAPICAEVLANMMSNTPIPIPISILDACNPNRFLLRQMGLKRLISQSTFVDA